MRQAFTGCGTALVTPFTRSGALDETGVRRLARRQIEAGIHFLVPCGTTGETPTLTAEERLRVVEIVVAEAKGKVPVLAGAGGYNTHEVIEAAQQMARAAPTASSRSRRTTTSLRPKVSTSTTRRSPRLSPCRSSSTTCPAAPASTWTWPRSSASARCPTSSV